jgi:glycosyltransferase involved in cell wall biosynthesis
MSNPTPSPSSTTDSSEPAGFPAETPAGAVSPAGLVSFVIPVLDEEGNLEELHGKITAVMQARGTRHELVFVDDGSTDGSLVVLRGLQRKDPRVRIVQLRRNFGKAAAYSAGFDHARGEIVITMDADLQDDPGEIPLFLDEIAKGYDMVIGWKHRGKGPLGKSIPSKIFNRVVNRITGIRLHDFNCPFKAYRREVLLEIHVYGELHRYIPVLASSRGFSMTEIPISNLPRKSGRSKYGLERYMRGMLDLLTISFITRFAKRPMHLLGVSGILACGFGFGIVSFFVVAHFLHAAGLLSDRSWIIHDRPALSLSILLMMVGVQFFSIGLLGELFVTGSGKTRSDRGYSIKQVLEGEPPQGDSRRE